MGGERAEGKEESSAICCGRKAQAGPVLANFLTWARGRGSQDFGGSWKGGEGMMNCPTLSSGGFPRALLTPQKVDPRKTVGTDSWQSLGPLFRLVLKSFS